MLWKLLSSVVLINFVIVSNVEGNGTYIFLIFFVKLISRKILPNTKYTDYSFAKAVRNNVQS